MHSITNNTICFKCDLINHFFIVPLVFFYNYELKESNNKKFISISKKTLTEMYNSFYAGLNTISKDLFFSSRGTKYTLIIFQKTNI